MENDVNDLVEADSKRPYKLYAAILSAFLTTLITSDVSLPPWAKGLIVSFLAGLAVYITRNPITRKNASPSHRTDALF
jgi:hypothetical protein